MSTFMGRMTKFLADVFGSHVEEKKKRGPNRIPEDPFRCQAITKSGERCKFNRIPAMPYCSVHRSLPVGKEVEQSGGKE